MTCVNFFADKNGLYGFEISGHSTFDCDDENGRLVCAAVSSAAYMAANTITDVIGGKCDVKVSDARMYFTVKNPDSSANAVLKGFKLHIEQLSVQYGKSIRITEV